MKNLFLAAALLLQLSATAQSQIKEIKQGESSARDSITGITFKATDSTYVVYRGTKGGLYYWKTSKAGKKYKIYLPKK